MIKRNNVVIYLICTVALCITTFYATASIPAQAEYYEEEDIGSADEDIITIEKQQNSDLSRLYPPTYPINDEAVLNSDLLP